MVELRVPSQKKKHKPSPNCVIKKIRVVFPEEEHICVPFNNA